MVVGVAVVVVIGNVEPQNNIKIKAKFQLCQININQTKNVYKLEILFALRETGINLLTD